ncbi:MULTISPECIES: hypothetical protein [Asticcacaulis]|uniref:hypothetical protein n=1 Tax=Asticcacaulis TaxID=76890 RepID=UPI001AE63C16|nr:MULTISPECIES: hypothetical protein [Asticcacaulis]MBP2158075.1 hypothetical protein [Asticcacaulis solisilvae]MDR6799120.1 hypothetical protein [Asticcacaulis sp. BE141]
MSALIDAFETHDVAAIRKALTDGTDPNAPIGGKTPFVWLYEMYTRSPHFAEALRVLIDAGAQSPDPLLTPLLLDDAEALIGNLRQILEHRFYLDCAYTSLKGVSALHVCAEYNSINCARLLLGAGANVDDLADLQDDGTGGHSPIFHTVNSNGDHCRPMLELLVDEGASLDICVEALSWGRGFDWDTTLFDATPLSYAQSGLLPQFHRRPEQIYDIISYLYRRKHGTIAPIRNVPNKYLKG